MTDGAITTGDGRTVGFADYGSPDQVGVSTGGAYALAMASQSPRVMGAVACCAVTDMAGDRSTSAA